MSGENSQPDITDRQMLAVGPQPASVWTEIGEARITHNIFGKARVRIIRKNDNIRRAMWWGAVIVIAAIAWQGWARFQRSEQQGETSPPAAVPEAQQAPAEPSRNEPIPAANSVMDGAAAPAEVVKRPIVKKQAAAQEPRVKTAVPVHKPVATRRPPSGASQAKPAEAAKAPLEAAAKPVPPRQPGMPYIGAPRPVLPTGRAASSPASVAAPRTVQQPAASSPADTMRLSPPVGEEQNLNQPPAGTTAPAQTGSPAN
jgi:hypothetical protein